LYPANPENGVLFEYPRYVIKGGEVVVEEGELRTVTHGREFISRPSYADDIEAYLRPRFEEVYTISFDNYPVEIERLGRPEVRSCG
jgi:formylmethanofuran dehydrogenase subunit A